MSKSFNSNSAKMLAKKYNLTLKNIPVSRKDGKVTIKDVENARNMSTFGSVFGLGMMGNTTPFMQR